MDNQHDIIDTLHKAEAELKKGNEIFDEIIKDMNLFVQILNKIKSVITNFKTFDSAVKAIEELLTLLSAFPVIGTVVNIVKNTIAIISDGIKSIDETLKTVKNTIDEVINILNSYISTAKKISYNTKKLLNDISNYILILERSLNMLKFILIFVNMLKYIDKNAYNKIVNRIAEYQKNFESVYEYFQKIYDEVKKLLDIDFSNMKKVFGEIGKEIDKTENALSSVLNIFSPIQKAFEEIYKYLYPLKWVLKAIGFLINFILKPAIKFIMKVTGIQSLVDKLSDKILDELGIKSFIESINNKLDIKELRVFDNMKIISDENILNKLNDEFNKLVCSAMLTEIFKDIIKIDIDPDKPFVINAALDNNMAYENKNEDLYMDFSQINNSFLNNIVYNDKNYYLQMNYSTDANNALNIAVANDMCLIDEIEYIDISKLEKSKCFTYNKKDIDKLKEQVSDFVNNISNNYTKIMFGNNSIYKLDDYVQFIDSYLYELDNYNSLISETLEYVNKIDETLKNNDKYKKLYQVVNKLNSVISDIMKDIDMIRDNINLLHNSKEYLLNEIKYIFDLIRNEMFLSNITMTAESYAIQLNNTLSILDSLYDKTNDDNKVFLKEKADNILKYTLKDIEDNISMLNKNVLNIENYFDTVSANIRDYDDYVSAFVSKDNFIPKEIYSNAFNLRNIIKNIYDNIYFECYVHNIIGNNSSKFLDAILKNIDLNIDENIINNIENKISADDIKTSLDYITSHNDKFNKLLNSISEINKNDINLHNYTDKIYDMVKYKIESDEEVSISFNKEETEKIISMDNKIIEDGTDN